MEENVQAQIKVIHFKKRKYMNIKELKVRENITSDDKLHKLYTQFRELLIELKKKELTENIIRAINQAVEEINTSTLTGNELKKCVKQKQTALLKQIEKELKIVPKTYYQTLWMLFGFSGFGIPIGLAIAYFLGNAGLFGLGLPIGLGVGAVVGLSLDKKALKEGRQLDLVIKY